jgi:hypothetical protein
MRTLLSCLLLGSIALIGCTESTNQKNIEPRTLTPKPVSENQLPGQYIVILKEGANSEVLKQVFTQYGIKAIQDLSKDRYLIILEQDPGPETISRQAVSASDIEAVQPNYIYRALPSTQDKPQ